MLLTVLQPSVVNFGTVKELFVRKYHLFDPILVFLCLVITLIILHFL